MAYTALTLNTMSAVSEAVIADIEEAVDNVNGNSFQNNGRVLLYVSNGSGGELTVTIDTPYILDGLELTDSVITIDDGDEAIIGPFPTRSYNQRGSDQGKVFVDWSSGTSVTAAAIQY